MDSSNQPECKSDQISHESIGLLKIKLFQTNLDLLYTEYKPQKVEISQNINLALV